MSLDFRQVQEQVRQLGKNAPQHYLRLDERYQRARDLLQQNAHELEKLRELVEQARQEDPGVRCALPLDAPSAEPLDGHYPLPEPPAQATLIAADGSQINPDRHAAVNYCLINVGALRMYHGSSEPPQPFTQCRLLYDDQLYTPNGTLTEETVALMRDLSERRYLTELAEGAPPPVITFTDGPMELWGSKDEAGRAEFQRHLKDYMQVLKKLCQLGVITAGYVDKPGADLVVRLLEIVDSMGYSESHADVRKHRPLRGVTDRQLYKQILKSGERSPVFAIQSRSLDDYREQIALRFFYLNVGVPGDPWLARVEIPAWVAVDAVQLNSLHAILVHQCRIMGGRPYPYLLHRAHETAVVSLDEKEQLTRMILIELRNNHIDPGQESYKLALKLTNRRRRSR